MGFFNHPDCGKRIILKHTSDIYMQLRPGAVGTIIFVDDAGTRHIKWDCGSRLGLVPGEDIWEETSE